MDIFIRITNCYVKTKEWWNLNCTLVVCSLAAFFLPKAVKPFQPKRKLNEMLKFIYHVIITRKHHSLWCCVKNVFGFCFIRMYGFSHHMRYNILSSVYVPQCCCIKHAAHYNVWCIHTNTFRFTLRFPCIDFLIFVVFTMYKHCFV